MLGCVCLGKVTQLTLWGKIKSRRAGNATLLGSAKFCEHRLRQYLFHTHIAPRDALTSQRGQNSDKMINDFPPTVTSVSADANTPAAASTALFIHFLPITASVLLMKEQPYAKI